MKILKEDKIDIGDLYNKVSSKSNVIYNINDVLEDIQKESLSIEYTYEKFWNYQSGLLDKGSKDSTYLYGISNTSDSLSRTYNELVDILKDLKITSKAIKSIVNKTYSSYIRG